MPRLGNGSPLAGISQYILRVQLQEFKHGLSGPIENQKQQHDCCNAAKQQREENQSSEHFS